MAYEQVASQFANARSYAASATNQATSFITAMNATVAGLQLPQFNFDMTWPVAPVFNTPATQAVVLPAVSFPADDTGAVPDRPDVAFDTLTAPDAPSLPSVTFTPGYVPDQPGAPSISSALTLPTDPGDWQPPAAPTLLNITVRAFGGVNNFADLAAQLTNLPTDLQLTAPTSYVAPTEGQYTSNFLGALRDELRRRLAGGTGIAPAVEAQIWARAQSREAGVTDANIAEVMRNAETRGFALPSGAMAAQLREAQKTALGKYSELSTDIAVKQAELEQANVKHAIEQGVEMEGQLISYSNSMMTRAFDAAKYLAENAVAVYNTLVETYRANLEKYSAYANTYKALVDGERAKVEMYSAEIAAEGAKATMNRVLIEQQRAQIDVRNSDIALYRERLGAVQAVLALDNVKLQAFGERVRAYSAGISAEAARVEVYNAQLRGNQTTVDTYKANVDAYSTKMRAISDAAKVKADVYDSTVRAFASKAQVYGSRVAAAAQQITSAVSVEGLKLEQGRLDSANTTSGNQLQIEQYRANISLYEATKSVATQQAKLISENYFALRNLVAEASKVAAQVNAQLAASAFGSIQANASINGNSATNVSYGYDYKGEFTTPIAPLTLPVI